MKAHGVVHKVKGSQNGKKAVQFLKTALRFASLHREDINYKEIVDQVETKVNEKFGLIPKPELEPVIKKQETDKVSSLK